MDNTASASGAQQPLPPSSGDKERYWVLIASILGSSMAFINSTAVNMALDPMMTDLNAGLSETLWIASIYTLFLAALMLLGGAAGDYYGRRKVFMTGVSLFTLASFACAMAPNPLWLIVARAVQGMGAAMIAPMSLTLIADAFPRKERATAIGIWSASSAVMTALGPPIGGWLAAHESWRLIFHFTLPFGIVTLALTLFCTRAKRAPRHGEHLDIMGAVYAVATCFFISYGLIALSGDIARFSVSWSAISWAGPIILGLAALWLFVWTEQRSSNPMVPIGLLKIRPFKVVNWLTVCLYGAMGGLFVFYPIILNDAYGLGVDKTGIVFMGFVIPMALITALSGVLIHILQARFMLTVGSLIAAGGLACMGLFEFSGTMGGAFGAMFVFGLGMGLVVPAMSHTLFNSTPEDVHGTASGLNNAFARAATLFAIVGYGVVAAYVYGLYAPAIAQDTGFGTGDSLIGPAQAGYRQAMAQSFRVLTLISIVFAIAAAMTAYGGLREPRSGSRAGPYMAKPAKREPPFSTPVSRKNKDV